MVVKIALFGPKPYFLGGHNPGVYLRDSLCNQIRTVLWNLRKECGEDTTVLGITGLNIGAEQDFASICLAEKIEYMVLSAHDDEKARLPQVPGLLEHYNNLLENAISHRVLSPGSFTNRKQSIRNKRIIDMADIIISVDYPKSMGYTNQALHDLVASSKKRLIRITPNYAENSGG